MTKAGKIKVGLLALARSAILECCDFNLAKEVLAETIRLANREAAEQGAEAFFKQEYIAGWKRFSEKPCLETALAWLDEAPDYEPILMSCFAECATLRA